MLAVVLRRPATAAAALTCHSIKQEGSCSGVWWSARSTSLYHQDAAHAEYTDKAKYPEILPAMSPKAKQQGNKKEWYDKVTKLPTVEQKMMELNMPRYYGHWSCHIVDNRPMLLSADFCQFATRTHMQEGLPAEYYSDVWQEAESVVSKVAGQVEQLIDFNYGTQIRRHGKSSTSLKTHQNKNFVDGLHRILAGVLHDTPHIREATVDFRPRIEAYWILGSLPPDEMTKKTRRGVPWVKNKENDPMERPIQGVSTPSIGVRVGEGLPEVVSREDVLATTGQVPGNDVDPRALGFKFSHKHATTVTGCWPSEGNQYGHLFLHMLDYEDKFEADFGAHNLRDAFIHKAVMSSFTQAQAHATYLGFGPVTELTYPLVQQSVYTNGHRWTLGLYQLNTCALHSEKPINNPYNNILWLSEDQCLFDEVDAGGVKGLNTNLLTSLVAMYLKKGVPNSDPTPYLPLKLVANHPAVEEYRETFHQYYLWLTSNRPRHLEKPEVYLWEKIYKVDFETRPLDPPRRFFEKHYAQKDPGQRRLDDYMPIYIPKNCRTHRRKKSKPRLNTELLYKHDMRWFDRTPHHGVDYD